MDEPYVPYEGPLVTRKEAQVTGQKMYFTGIVCAKGHRSQRRICNFGCVACQDAAHKALKMERGWERKNFPKQLPDVDYVPYDGPIILRDAAQAVSASFYYSGVPCKYGHLSRRYVSIDRCEQCRRNYSEWWIGKFPERHRANCLDWLSKNKVRQRANVVAWGDANPEAVQAHWRNRRARKRDAVGSHTASDILEIFDLQKGRCAYCKKMLGKKYEVDHIVSLVNGGRNDRTNLQLTCTPCNRSKGSKDPNTYARMRGLLI